MTPSDTVPGTLQARRIVDFLGMPVQGADGRILGRVNDLRLSPTRAVRGPSKELMVDGLVVDGKHPGSLLGYDRRSTQGPWLVRAAVRALHRHAGYLPWETVAHIDWDARRVTVSVTALELLIGLDSRRS
jgi:hypothetical protein